MPYVLGTTHNTERLNMTLPTSKRTSSRQREHATVQINSILRRKERAENAYQRQMTRHLRHHLRRQAVIDAGVYTISWATTHYLLQKDFRSIDAIIRQSIPDGWQVMTCIDDAEDGFVGWRFDYVSTAP